MSTTPERRRRDRVLIALLGWRSSEWAMRNGKTHYLLKVPRPIPKHSPSTLGWWFPAMLEVWRKRDQVTVRFWPAFNLRRWLFTRCEACGKRGPYGWSPTYRHGHDACTKSILLGETGCYHHGCATDPQVEYSNTDSWDRQWGHDDGLRRNILHEPVDVALELAMLASVRRDADMAYRKRLVETRREAGLDNFRWRYPDRDKESADAV